MEELAFEQERRLAPPAFALRKPRKGAASNKLPGCLGDYVIISRRAPAGERGQVLLVPADLRQCEGVMLEKSATPGQSSRRRRIQARLIRRMPSSMPFVQ